MKLQKRMLALLLCLLLSLMQVLAACTREKGTEAGVPETTQTPETAPADPATQTPETAPADPATQTPDALQPAGGTTVMIYMVGSDLESKGGAGTQDLEEIAGSGVNLDTCNVAVYAGGSEYWHSGAMQSGNNELLFLTAGGFVPVQELESCSMGEAETLRSFLDACVDRFPAEHYVLILWDHGNGPVMGYGLDTAFGGDRLTLSEMRQALEASPFGGALRLDWVGFDACLMSSAELAVVLQDYADYLIASQETEPRDGWPYAFLADLDAKPAETLLKELGESYLAQCLDYFAQKGYEGRESTLACLDLRQTDALVQAVNDLFEAASADLPGNYDELARSRDRTWNIGKTTTNSEYDLVDLADMCELLRDRYPEQTAAVERVLSEMVLSNATNGERLCGVSLFYPFYNKPYYKKEWQQTYRDMELFSGYQSYLEKYGEIWLGSDLLEDYAGSGRPSQAEAGVYTLELTPEQAAHLSSARYYILERVSGEIFLREFVGTDVTLRGNRLEARFDGSVIYVRNQTTGEVMIPAVEETGHNDAFVYYTASAMGLTPDQYLLATVGQGSEGIRFYLSMDRQTGAVHPMSIQPDTHQTKADGMTQGRKDEVDLNDYTALCWDVGRPSYLTRTEEGVILPFEEWKQSAEIKNYGSVNLADGYTFGYGPVPGEQYALMFELRDTQGNRYCSEPIDIAGQTLEVKAPEVVETTADLSSDTEAVLLERDGVTLRLVLEEGTDPSSSFHLKLENRSDRSVGLCIDDMLYNGEYSGTVLKENLLKPIRPGETDDYTLQFGLEMTIISSGYNVLPAIESISLRLTLLEVDSAQEYFISYLGMKQLYKTLWDDLELNVRIQGIAQTSVGLYDINMDLYGALAEPQVLAESDKFLAELTGVLTYDDGAGVFIRVENRWDRPIQVRCRNIAIDGIVVPTQMVWGVNTHLGGVDMTPPIPAGKQAVMLVYLTEEHLVLTFGRKPGRLQLGLSLNYSAVTRDLVQYTEYTDEFYWCDVALSGAAENEPLEVPLDRLQLLCTKDGVSVWLLDQYDDGAYTFYAENNGEASVCIQISDLGYDDEETSPAIQQRMECTLGPGMKTFGDLNLSSEEDHQQVKFRFTTLNPQKNAILWQSSQIRLPYPYEG